MKITKRDLRQMINESVREVLFEHGRGARLRDRTDDRFAEDPLVTRSNHFKSELNTRRIDKIQEKLLLYCSKISNILGGSFSFSKDCKDYDFYIEFKRGYYPKSVIRFLENQKVDRLICRGCRLPESKLEWDEYDCLELWGDYSEEVIQMMKKLIEKL